MKDILISLQYILGCACFIYSIISNAAFNTIVIEQQASTSIKKLYHRLNSMPNTSMVNRIDWISNQFKGTDYLLGSLGEGPSARYDQFPSYRVDAFDCDTYVNTVIALALADSLTSFQHCLKDLRYKDGKMSYINRNHFTSIDWNINNQKKGILKDITVNIHNQQNKSVALFATTIIDKSNWYAYKTKDAIRLQKENRLKQEQFLDELKSKTRHLNHTPSDLPYIPFTALFPQNNVPDLYLFSQIPSGAIIEIVRPNWNLREVIGTSLNVSHLGFAIWHDNVLYFREASSQYGKVVDVPLITYLKNARASKTIKGINVQIILPKKTINS
ncbi:MAG: DUF1460 domain-containing protein [bacterium]|nr:DUF1460 domain-containing protein [bacterium]